MAEQAVSGAIKLAEKWELPLSKESAICLALYLSKLVEWNRHVNLTGARDLHEILDAHLPDSFALAKLCPERANVDWVPAALHQWGMTGSVDRQRIHFSI